MKARSVCALFFGLALLCSIGFAADPQYQAGKVVKVEKRGSAAPSGGTDAPLKAAVTTYNISIQLDNKVYVCSYKTDPDNDISWIEGKDVEARASGKTMYVKKANGKEAKGSILRTTAANP